MKEEKVKIDSRIGCNICTTDILNEMHFEPHFHKEIEICYAIKGEKIQRIGNKVFHSKPGDLLLVNSNESHEINTLGNNKSLVILIEYGYILKYCPILQKIKFDLNIDLKSKAEIAKICEDIYYHSFEKNEVISHYGNKVNHYPEYKDNYEYILVKSEILKIIYLLLHNHSLTGDYIDSRRIQKMAIIERIFNYIEANYCRKITLEKISNDLGYSPFYVSKIFKEYTGVKLFDYLNLFRMEKCMTELRNSNRSIKDIAEQNGFSNYKNFQNQFRKLYNITPTEYRNKNTY